VKSAWEVREKGGYATTLLASSIRYDDSQQPRMQTFLDKHVLPFVDTHYWLPLYSMGSFATNREHELGYRPIAGNQGRMGALREPLPCWAVFTEGHVTADGKLSACCFDAGGHWTMGDLTKHSFMECWNSAPFNTLRAAHLKKDVRGTVCEKCVAYS
jgi:radical SAM protein with 4Fe4S-binding SPASM domain